MRQQRPDVSGLPVVLPDDTTARTESVVAVVVSRLLRQLGNHAGCVVRGRFQSN